MTGRNQTGNKDDQKNLERQTGRQNAEKTNIRTDCQKTEKYKINRKTKKVNK